MPKLMLLFIFPFLCAIFAFASSPLSEITKKRGALFLSLVPLFILLISGGNGLIGSSVHYSWLPQLEIEFFLKVDSLSLLFLYLTNIIIPISIFALRSDSLNFSAAFYGFIFTLQGLLIGFFTARDLVLFVVFWEAMLFPLYFIISLWGKERRKNAALKFLIYMIGGSSLLVAAVLALFFASASLQGRGTFNIEELQSIASSVPHAAWIFAVFVLAFCVKTPLFPFHAWLPDAYTQAPTTGSILLSSLLSKAGIYGFFRIGLGMFPELLQRWSPPLLALSIVGVLYGGLAAWRQSDYKRLIAYSSFSHVNFILAGIFVWNETAHEGAMLQAINHGITIAGLFLVAGWLEERIGTTAIGPVSGAAKWLPQLCWLTMIFVLSAIALPGTNSFIGEFLILFGIFGKHPWQTAILGISVVLSVIYMLRWMQKVYFEEKREPLLNSQQISFGDIGRRELLIALPLVALIFWIGLYPGPVLEYVAQAVEIDMKRG